MKPPILLIGAGGHARACIDVIEQEARFSIFGLLDASALKSGVTSLLGYKILGGDELLPSLLTQVQHAHIALGQIKTAAHRMRIYQNLKQMGYNLPSIKSPLAYIAKGAVIQEGTIIMHHALINANATIGRACIINSKALVEHDCVIGDFCHLSTASVVNGGSHIGEQSFLGSNMMVRHNVHIAPKSVLYKNPLESQIFTESTSAPHAKNLKDIYFNGGGDSINVFTPLCVCLDSHTFVNKNSKFSPLHFFSTQNLSLQNPLYTAPKRHVV